MRKPSILIVEDEKIVAEDIRCTLERSGYTVKNIVNCGEKTLAILSHNSIPDLVLMDIQLNGEVDGIKTAEIINQKYNVPVVFLTSYSDDNLIQEAKLTCPYGYIIKPYDEKGLKSTLEITFYKHKMERRLKDNERWLTTIFNCIGDGVIVTDKNDRIKYINRIALKLTGWKREEALNKKWMEVYKLEDKRLNKISQIMDYEVLFKKRKDAYLETRNSLHLPISNSISLLKDDNGNNLGKIFVFHDIINRKMSEKALKESEKRYRSLFEESLDAIFITTIKGRFLVVNQSTIDLFHYSKNKLLELSIKYLFVIPEEWKNFKKSMEENGSLKNFEVKLKDKHGKELSCLLTSTIHRAKNNKVLGFQGIIRNITEQKRAQDEKEKIQYQLMQAQKMKAVGVLAGGIAHDFNNLLTVIQGNSDLIIQNFNNDDPIYNEIKELQIAASKAAELTGQLLLFSKNKPMKFFPFNLNTVVMSMLKMLNRLIGEDLTINTVLSERLWKIYGDKNTMEQVILNFVVNARDAMPSGGTVTISTQNVEVNEKSDYSNPEISEGKYVLLTISDTGQGMDDNTLQHLFEPFFTTKDDGKGTGLGLAVVYGIVKKHNGIITVNSTLGKGSVFKVYLPATFQEENKIEKLNLVSDKSLKGNGKGILLVEDEKSVRDFCESILIKYHYKVWSVEGAEEALKVYKKKKKNIDLVLTDVVLKNDTGLDLVDRILDLNPNENILLCSGYSGKKSRLSTIKERGFDFLSKPFSLRQLLSKVKEVIEKPVLVEIDTE